MNRAYIAIVLAFFIPDGLMITSDKAIGIADPMAAQVPHVKRWSNQTRQLCTPQPGHRPKGPHMSFCTMTNSIGMKLVEIPSGEFMMGSDDGNPDERPIHRVVISQDFWIGIYEVTQAQYKAVMDKNPSKFQGDDLPVETVSWHDAERFCRRLSQMEGRLYRLPTEAEWEYTCRAGSTAKFCFGDDSSALGDYAWYTGNYDSQTHSVGQRLPNAFGLHDMHGNVLEWCQDRYDDR